MLSSKEILVKSDISRATLNNYVALGILPRPVLKKAPKAAGRAPRLGYFPDSTLDIIKRVNALKSEGLSMNQIAEAIRGGAAVPAKTKDVLAKAKKADTPPITPPQEAAPCPPVSRERRRPGEPLRLTVDHIEHPAYLVNNNFDVEWCNKAASEQILGGDLSADISESNLFSLILGDGPVFSAEGRDDILRFHLSLAKKRLSRAAVCRSSSAAAGIVAKLYDEVETVTARNMLDTEVNLAPPGETERWRRIYASFFREGIFFVYAPASDLDDSLLSLLARRDIVIRDLLKNRRPYLTELSVLVADLQDSVKICAELPPEEYFKLINDIWGAMDPLLRKHYATHGKHVGDGMVYYFFPQPDCSHIYNAMCCAHEMRLRMQEVSREWQSRKNWLNELRLNSGLEEGQEWFGSYQTPTHL